ncbi:HlyD family secretion protein [Phocaeicola sp.]|uniref:HlyD family secretion protein n=1 Tax=Phocaeicola sp. TaxID=2773926 RepID=UPI0023BB8AC7|nr:HlyD family secretion protein [Phocaeicola sp.]MDE5677092.1 HlyD family secretion protein [Phocaeicola sp.]
MKHSSKKTLSYSITLIVIAAAALWVGSKFIHLGRVEFTDNAQVRRQIVPVNSRVQGYIKEIRFGEYEKVKKGDTLVIIDDADMRLNVARANADYRNALAGRSVADRSVASASANVAVSEASIAEAKVLMDHAATDLARYEKLLGQDAVTRQQYDGAKTDYAAKKARYEMLARQRSATSSVVDINRQRISQSEAGIELAKALLETAELNLSYTVILAPCDGYTSRKEIQEGQLVQPGQTLLDVVESGDVWVAANYKETQLHHIAPGSKVEIKVDAIPGIVFQGKVRSLSTATGASLSLMPQDNSAGNFVKVRQRIPVRIEFTENNRPEDMERLGAGMNVECSVKY